MRLKSEDRDEFLADVATLYYIQRLNQEEIAARLSISRSNVSKLLQEAQKRRIVQFRIVHRLPQDDELQDALISRFHLQSAFVLRGEHVRPDLLTMRVGELAARQLETLLHGKTALAVTWGTALRAVADALSPLPGLGIDVVQMIGSAGAHLPEVDGIELARLFALLLGGRFWYLPAPLVVDDPALAEALRQHESVRPGLERAARAELALVGIGALVSGVSSLQRAGYLDECGIARLQQQGAVGDICGWHFDITGRILEIDINKRIIALEPGLLKRIPAVMAVAAGKVKAPAILGALRTGAIHVLVTDSETGREVLRLDEETST